LRVNNEEKNLYIFKSKLLHVEKKEKKKFLMWEELGEEALEKDEIG